MTNSEGESKRPRGFIGKVINYLALFLLFSSSAFIVAPGLFGPLLLSLSVDVQEAVGYYYFLTFVSYHIFAFSIILLMVNNVFRFFRKPKKSAAMPFIDDDE